MPILFSFSILLIHIILISVVVAYTIEEELLIEARCYGIELDFDRLQTVTIKDVDWLLHQPKEEQLRSFSPSQVETVTDENNNDNYNNGIRGDRVRLREAIGNIDVYGAETVVMLESCEEGHACATNIESLRGKTFQDIHVSGGYDPTHSESEAKAAIARYFLIGISDVGDLSLEVYPSKQGDFLSYIGQAFVGDLGHPQLYDVVIDAHTLTILQRCNRFYDKNSGSSNKHHHGSRQRRRILDAFQKFQEEGSDNSKMTNDKSLRPNQQQQERKKYQRKQQEEEEEEEQLQHIQETDFAFNKSWSNIKCERCAEFVDGIEWSDSLVECPINSIYLNDTGRTAICVRDTSNSHNGPGEVPELFWGGTFDCNSTVDDCRIVPLPVDCPDVSSDAHYAALQTLRYLRDYLGVMGGLSLDASDPKPVKAYVHYDDQYCNAFFRPGKDAVYFGDCDCSFRTPLPAVDIVAHEITHGVTQHTSNLISLYQAGGLNEGFSDIVAAAVEVLVDDSWDRPDFDFGEMVHAESPIRSMSDPTGKYLRSVCDFDPDTDNHYASGPVDLAYVTAVNACVATNFCASLKDCIVLMSSSFMYANMHGLTSLSGYLDAAEATCDLVDEFFSVHKTPPSCDNKPEQVQQFIKEGWCMVNIALDSDCEASYECGQESKCGSFGHDKDPDDSVPWLFRVSLETIPNWIRNAKAFVGLPT